MRVVLEYGIHIPDIVGASLEYLMVAETLAFVDGYFIELNGLDIVANENARITTIFQPPSNGIISLSVLEDFIKAQSLKPNKLTVFAPESEFSKISGHKKCNSKALYERYKTQLVLKKSDSFSISAE